MAVRAFCTEQSVEEEEERVGNPSQWEESKMAPRPWLVGAARPRTVWIDLILPRTRNPQGEKMFKYSGTNGLDSGAPFF
jgi:hypothetical protein